MSMSVSRRARQYVVSASLFALTAFAGGLLSGCSTHSGSFAPSAGGLTPEGPFKNTKIYVKNGQTWVYDRAVLGGRDAEFDCRMNVSSDNRFSSTGDGNLRLVQDNVEYRKDGDHRVVTEYGDGGAVLELIDSLNAKPEQMAVLSSYDKSMKLLCESQADILNKAQESGKAKTSSSSLFVNASLSMQIMDTMMQDVDHFIVSGTTESLSGTDNHTGVVFENGRAGRLSVYANGITMLEALSDAATPSIAVSTLPNGAADVVYTTPLNGGMARQIIHSMGANGRMRAFERTVDSKTQTAFDSTSIQPQMMTDQIRALVNQVARVRSLYMGRDVSTGYTSSPVMKYTK